MDVRIIEVGAGSVLVAAGKKIAERHLDVSLEDGRLVIRVVGRIVDAIRGAGMAELVTSRRTAPPTGDVRRELIPPGATAQLTTPHARGSTCVYVENVGGRLSLTGGASIIARIEGDGLKDSVEDDDGDLIAHMSPRAALIAQRLRNRRRRRP